MNIGVVVDNEFNNDTRVRNEVSILQKRGYKIHVLCFSFNGEEYDNIEGVNISRIAIRKRIKNLLFFFLNRFSGYERMWKKKIAEFITKNSIDILHVHDLYMSKPARLGVIRTKRNIPVILDLHENYPAAIQSYNWTRGAIRGFLSNPKAWIIKEAVYLDYASKLIVLSDFFKNDLLGKYDFLEEQNILSFPNVVDIRRFEKFEIDDSIKRSSRVTLLYFGVVAERRGIFDLLDAFHTILQKEENIELLIIGPTDKLDKEKFSKGINNPYSEKNIKYIPWIDITELLTYINLSDICVAPFLKNPQHESGVANKIFQYMYGAKPIIASNCRPHKELIESFDCGRIYSSQDEFVKCIEELIHDSELRDRLGKNGYRELYNRFDNENFENLLVNLYKDAETQVQTG